MTPKVVERHGVTIGRKMLVYDELNSTNDTAKELSADGQNHGTVIVAKHQTLGRGQYGRVWTAAPGSSLLFSVILHPPTELRRAVMLTAWAAVALGDALKDLGSVDTRIKWPNDLYVKDKKIAGILIEQSAGVVVGMGLNVNQSAEDFASANLPDAISLAMAKSEVVPDVLTVLEPILMNLNAGYECLVQGEQSLLETEWAWRLGLVGRTSTATLHDGRTLTGKVMAMGFPRVSLATETGLEEIMPEHIRGFAGG